MSNKDIESVQFVKIPINDLEGQAIQNRLILKELFDMDPSKISAMVGVVIQHPVESEDHPGKKMAESKIFAAGDPIDIIKALNQLNQQLTEYISKNLLDR